MDRSLRILDLFSGLHGGAVSTEKAGHIPEQLAERFRVALELADGPALGATRHDPVTPDATRASVEGMPVV